MQLLFEIPQKRNVLDPGQDPEQAQGRLFVRHLVVELELLERRTLVHNLFQKLLRRGPAELRKGDAT